jgi:hypothetical protein
MKEGHDAGVQTQVIYKFSYLFLFELLSIFMDSPEVGEAKWKKPLRVCVSVTSVYK